MDARQRLLAQHTGRRETPQGNISGKALKNMHNFHILFFLAVSICGGRGVIRSRMNYLGRMAVSPPLTLNFLLVEENPTTTIVSRSAQSFRRALSSALGISL